MSCPTCGAFDMGADHTCSPVVATTPAPGRHMPPPPPQPPAPAAEIGKAVSTASHDAFGALRKLSVDPVGGLPEAYASLGPDRARAAGAALCVGFALLTTLGVLVGAKRLLPDGIPLGGSGLADVLKTFLVLLVLPAAFAAASFATRKVLRAAPPISADLMTAGAALIPSGAATVAAGLLGLGNLEIVLALYLFALCYLVLLLYGGLTGIGGVASRVAVPAVPLLILAAGWIAKVVIAALL